MTNKLKYFIGNWKMFGDYGSLKVIKQIYKFRFSFKSKRNKIVVCVPNTLISLFAKKTKSKFFHIGAQDCHQHPGYGAFTGSVSALMLKKVGAKYVILGHSENRKNGDTKKIIQEKIKSALDAKINIIFCFGETLNEKRSKKTFSIIKNQILGSIKKNYNINNILFAYEPVWSIGTGKTPNIIELKKIFNYIKNEIKKNFKTTSHPIVLYGGSVNHNNISMFSSISEIDGFLIGGASQTAKKFIDIIKNYYK